MAAIGGSLAARESGGYDPATVGRDRPADRRATGFGSAFLAPLGDRWGRRPVIISFLAVVGVASLGSALADGLTDFVIWRFIMGLGLGASLANATALTSEISPARSRARLITLMF